MPFQEDGTNDEVGMCPEEGAAVPSYQMRYYDIACTISQLNKTAFSPELFMSPKHQWLFGFIGLLTSDEADRNLSNRCSEPDAEKILHDRGIQTLVVAAKSEACQVKP